MDVGIIIWFQILEEFSRRRQADEQSQWDFRALDQNGSSRLPLSQALLLFQVTHGDQFSMDTWHAFLNDRQHPDIDVSYDEMRPWLCAPPGEQQCNRQQIENEKERMKEEQRKRDEQQVNDYINKKVYY